MAGLGFKVFQDGDVLTATEVNGYMMEQQIMVFANAAARDAALPTPSEGMFAYLKDTDRLMVYTTTWRNV
jgi:hypothetical protein